MNKELVEFVRDRKNNPIGVVVANLHEDTIQIGWSLCKVKVDTFNKEKALMIARNRAGTGTGKEVTIPREVGKTIHRIADRAERYFKGYHVGSLCRVY